MSLVPKQTPNNKNLFLDKYQTAMINNHEYRIQILELADNELIYAISGTDTSTFNSTQMNMLFTRIRDLTPATNNILVWQIKGDFGSGMETLMTFYINNNSTSYSQNYLDLGNAQLLIGRYGYMMYQDASYNYMNRSTICQGSCQFNSTVQATSSNGIKVQYLKNSDGITLLELDDYDYVKVHGFLYADDLSTGYISNQYAIAPNYYSQIGNRSSAYYYYSWYKNNSAFGRSWHYNNGITSWYCTYYNYSSYAPFFVSARNALAGGDSMGMMLVSHNYIGSTMEIPILFSSLDGGLCTGFANEDAMYQSTSSPLIASVNSSGSFLTYSDKRRKQGIRLKNKQNRNILGRLKQLSESVVTFRTNQAKIDDFGEDDEEKARRNVRKLWKQKQVHQGFIAQDLWKIFPRAVHGSFKDDSGNLCVGRSRDFTTEDIEIECCEEKKSLINTMKAQAKKHIDDFNERESQTESLFIDYTVLTQYTIMGLGELIDKFDAQNIVISAQKNKISLLTEQVKTLQDTVTDLIGAVNMLNDSNYL